MNLENLLNNNLTNEKKLNIGESQNNFLESMLGKTINFGLDIGLRALLPNVVEDIVIEIKNGGKTIAVIGSGLDIIYPKENAILFNKIIESGGAIISEYPLGTKPLSYHFPARNRIISGLSNGVLVIEAKEKSGTLITVDYALEQGKDVFVVPGNINAINSTGTNRLIKEGAKLVDCISDILEEY